ncbi:MAG: iron-containing alcohol dehydrogenase [Fastidiosipilaceae bacterium]|jgi:alcohol dehydrogenase YqhD (iron-dependent ADH family)
MLDFTFKSPTQFVFGAGTEKKVGEQVRATGAKNVLVIYGGGSVIRSGLLERVLKSLDDERITHHQIGGVRPNPRVELVNECVDFALKNNIDLILGVGAGSVLDTCKAVAIGTANPETPLWDFYSYQVPLTRALPVASVMTFPATGSEGSNSSVINFTKKGLKRGLNSDHIRPIFAIMNPELTYTLSLFQTGCGVVDMMSHIMERYFSNTPDVELTDRLSEGLLRTIMEAASTILESPRDYGARANLMWASTLAHNNICGVGREQDWSCHALEHELSFKYDIAHGAGLAFITIAWLRYQLPRNPHKIVQFAKHVMGVTEGSSDIEIAELGIRRLASFFRSIGMPLTFEEGGCDPADIPELVKTVKRLPNGLVGQYAPLNDEGIEAVYRLSCEPPFI